VTPRTLLALALLGLFGGTHCVGMCGPLVGLFSSRLEARGARRALALAVFHGGRLSAYAVLGLLASLWGAAGVRAWPALGAGARVVAAVFVVLYGLRLAGALPAGEVRLPLEGRLGARVRAALGRLLPLRTLPAALAAGGLWAMLPCGLVYSAVAVCASVGEPGWGAVGMLAFGLGALPWLLFVDAFVGFARRLVQRPWARRAAGVAIVTLGAVGVAQGVRGGLAPSAGADCHASRSSGFEGVARELSTLALGEPVR